MNVTIRLEIESIQGFFLKTVQRFGASAKYNRRIKIPQSRRSKIPVCFLGNVVNFAR